MIPQVETNIDGEVLIERMPSKTYAISENGTRILGKSDGREALRQAIYLLLNIERYAYLIYSWNYGAELANKIGSHLQLSCLNVKRAICEALLQDDRIVAAEKFSFEMGTKKLRVSFLVRSIWGDIESEANLDV